MFAALADTYRATQGENKMYRALFMIGFTAAAFALLLSATPEGF